jgi:Tol biopolymer transport system component
MRKLVVIVCLAAVAAAVGATPGGAVTPPANGLIAYHEFDSAGAPQIWVVAPDGTGQTQLTNGALCAGCFAEAPQWQPGGSRIYFDSDRAGNVHIFSMKPDGSDVQQVTHSNGFEGYPAISPDATKLAYDGSDENGSGGIYVAGIDGSDPERITFPSMPGSNADGWDTNPDFGPNGKIAFVRLRFECPPSPRCARRGPVGFGGSIWVVNDDGTGLQRLTAPGGNWSDPQWSPDGSKLLIQSYDDRGSGHGISSDLYVINADGSGLRPLTRTRDGAFAYTGDWSPDGTKIVFHHFQFPDDHAELWLMNADGSGAGPIASCGVHTGCDFANWGTHE